MLWLRRVLRDWRHLECIRRLHATYKLVCEAPIIPQVEPLVQRRLTQIGVDQQDLESHLTECVA